MGPPPEAPLLAAVLRAAADVGVAPPPGPSIFRFSHPTDLARLLVKAGLERPRARQCRFSHRFPSSSAWWDTVIAGTVRTAALVASVSADRRARARERFDALAATYVVGDGLEIPVTVTIATGDVPPNA